MRRMIVLGSLVLSAAFLTASSAEAQMAQAGTNPTIAAGARSSHGRGIGVGAATMLNGASGALLTWGAPSGGFHVDGFFGLHHYKGGGTSTTSFSFGGRGWYHLHAASFADFSVGGGIGFTSWRQDPGTANSDRKLDVTIEAGSQIRTFIVPNVALIGDLGLGMNFGSSDDFLIGGQSVGGGAGNAANYMFGTLGIAYFFE